jgi:hypothetical protein
MDGSSILSSTRTVGGSSVVIKALCYKPEGRGFEKDLFSIYLILPAALGPGVY